MRSDGGALKGETVPDSLPATPKSPPTRRVPPRGHCHPRASSAKTRGFHTQLDEGPETP